MTALTLALEVYQQDPAAFYPYTSKYDAVLRGQADAVATAEARGKRWFDDAAKGNCASCHPTRSQNGFPAFTDFGFVASACRATASISANADPAYFDLGLCGPYRTDLAAQHRVLRHVPHAVAAQRRARASASSTTASFTTLDRRRARSTRRATSRPARWYPHGAKFDDLPAAYHGNVNREPPFGAQRHWTDAEIADIVAFLGDADDGYR